MRRSARFIGNCKEDRRFCAFVEFCRERRLDSYSHAKERVNKVTDILQEGDEVMVKVLEIDKAGKIRLSRKEAL
jgi:polyribonucleotide nucleotidyltransferase